MFYHVKDLQYNARVSRPDPAFATLLQFLVGSGGAPAYTNSQDVPWSAAYINGED